MYAFIIMSSVFLAQGKIIRIASGGKNMCTQEVHINKREPLTDLFLTFDLVLSYDLIRRKLLGYIRPLRPDPFLCLI